MSRLLSRLLVFFFTDTPPPDIYTLSLHDALPIWPDRDPGGRQLHGSGCAGGAAGRRGARRIFRAGSGRYGGLRADRKSTRLNSSHLGISYAVFCLKKKNNKNERT